MTATPGTPGSSPTWSNKDCIIEVDYGGMCDVRMLSDDELCCKVPACKLRVKGTDSSKRQKRVRSIT